MKNYPLLLFALVLAMLCGCSDSQEFQNQEEIFMLEQKVFRSTGLKNSIEKDYNLSLSDKDYKSYLHLMDTASYSLGHKFLVRKQLEAGQTIDIKYNYVTQETVDNYLATNEPITTTTITKSVSSIAEMESFLDKMERMENRILGSENLNHKQSVITEEGKKKIDEALDNNNYTQARQLLDSHKKKVNINSRTNGEDPPHPLDPFKCRTSDSGAGCGGGADSSPPTGHFVVNLGTANLHINITTDGKGGLRVNVFTTGEEINSSWDGHTKDVHYDGSGSALWKVSGVYSEGAHANGNDYSNSAYLEYHGYVDNSNGREGQGWPTSRSERDAVPVMK